MICRHPDFKPGQNNQKGVSILVALVMLLILTLIGVSSMNSSIVEIKMSTSMQQQGIALNHAEELLRVGESNIDGILANPAAYNFASAGDGYYIATDAIDVYQIDWSGMDTIAGTDAGDTYVIEYLGAKAIPGESVKIAPDGRIIGGAVHTFRITTRSVAGKGAVRLVQSMYVSELAP